MNAAGVEGVQVPEGAGEIAVPGRFGLEIPKMQGAGFDPNAGFVTIPAALNSHRLRALKGELVAVTAKDTMGNEGVFPGIILPQGKGGQAGKLRIGILNGPPGRDYKGSPHPGDRLAFNGVPTGDQAFFLRRMQVTEAPGAGAHDKSSVNVADVADFGVGIGMLMQPDWQRNPHDVAHELAGDEQNPGTGLSVGLSQQAGLTSIDKYRPQAVLIDPDTVFWNPKFDDVQPSLPGLAGYTEADLTAATGYVVVAQRFGKDRAQNVIAAGIAAMRASGEVSQ